MVITFTVLAEVVSINKYKERTYYYTSLIDFNDTIDLKIEK